MNYYSKVNSTLPLTTEGESPLYYSSFTTNILLGHWPDHTEIISLAPMGTRQVAHGLTWSASSVQFDSCQQTWIESCEWAGTPLCTCLFYNPTTIASLAPLSMGFPRQEYCGGLPLSSPVNLPDQGSNPHLLHCRQILYQWATREAH